ncbi:MAG: DASS family sodium-coupled anion symporter [Hyphomonadaceae bacterium]
MASSVSEHHSTASKIGLFLGPAVAALILILGAPEGMADGAHAPPAWIVLSLLALMAIWWVTEAIPIPVTSLLPLTVLPLTGVSSIAVAAQPYMHPIVILLMGGFIFAKAIERWGLHERIALQVVRRMGTSPGGIIGGFMLAAALLSMWISNSATSIMMMPIALSVAAAVKFDDSEARQNFTLALLLGIVYACSIGGLGTPVGTPTNLIVLGYLNDNGAGEIGFAQWMMLGLPVVLVMVPLTWWSLTKWTFKMPKLDISSANESVSARLQEIGKITRPEKRTLGIFVVIASLWIFRRPLNNMEFALGEAVYTPLSGLTDHVIAVIAVIVCFLIPAGSKQAKGDRILSWDDAESIPWGVLLLFGGGMSLAAAISSSGLSAYLGQTLSVVASYPTPVLVLLITAAVLALTEVTSNIATASALMPVLGSVALETGIPLEVMAAPVALAASCAFMLPMATGPNAVAFATGEVKLSTMARAGFRVNLIAIVVITIVAVKLAPIAIGS